MKKTRARKKATRRAAFIRAVAKEVVAQLGAAGEVVSSTALLQQAQDATDQVLAMRGRYSLDQPDAIQGMDSPGPWHRHRMN